MLAAHAARTSSIHLTGRIVSLSLMFFGISARSFSFSCGISTVVCRPMGGQQLLLQAADRQHLAAQRDLSGHRHIAANRDFRQCRNQGRTHANTRTRDRLSALRLLAHVHAHRTSGGSPCRHPARRPGCGQPSLPPGWTRSSRRPSWPVWVSLPLPGTTAASMVSSSPPTSVQARPVPARPGHCLPPCRSGSGARPGIFPGSWSVIFTCRRAASSSSDLTTLRQTLEISRSRLRTPDSRV